MRMQHRHRRIVAAVFLLAMPGLGCIAPIDAPQGVEINEAAILAEIASYRDPASFDHVSGMAYPSALGGSSMIALYASRTVTVPYADIMPEASGSHAVIPEGGIIVREVLDATGAAQRLTVMAKGPAGYNPELGDWYFAVTDLQGSPVIESGAPRSGRLADCFGCHLPRASDDYLFGVPMIDRPSGTSTTPPPPQGGGAEVCGDFACEGTETRTSCPKDCKHTHH
jgi:hypothetical protein